jgi:hypothetical protein
VEPGVHDHQGCVLNRALQPAARCSARLLVPATSPSHG